ncbi:MAG UNVERIFIED_CONTAM: hypothetical protein LVR18_42020 [Planctomycetaceae bacterium]
MNTRIRKTQLPATFRLVFRLAVICLVAAAGGGSGFADDTTVVVRSGGTGRFLYGRWGAVTASIANNGNSPATTLVVVTPSTGGLQYGRRIELPARISFDATWPVQVTGRKQPGPVDFKYLHFPGGVDDGVIRTRQSEKESPSFSALASEAAAGLAGYIPDMRDGERRDTSLMLMAQAYRFPKVGSAGLTSFLAPTSVTTAIALILLTLSSSVIRCSPIIRWPAIRFVRGCSVAVICICRWI